MSALPDPRQEAFARAMALERRLSEASSEAGYTGSRKNARQRAKRPDVVARVKALRDPPAVRTAGRGSRAEAAKPQGPVAAVRLTPEERARYLPLSDEDWLAEYGHKG